MKNVFPCFAILASILFLVDTRSIGQSVDVNPTTLKAPLAAIEINADLKDWGDSLIYYNAENNVRYQLSNDKENLYFAIRVDEPFEMVRVLSAGITLSVDPKGKNKEAYSITFPLNTQTAAASSFKPENILDGISKADRDELARETITTLRAIKVVGFKDIEGDMITTSNSYGIKAAINYDEKGSLVCEGSIALKLLHTDANAKNDWLYAIKINVPTHPSPANKTPENSGVTMSGGARGGGGRGGMGGGGGRGGRGGGNTGRAQLASTPDGVMTTKPIDFSGKFKLVSGQ